jgi:hypothetical protein
VKKKEKEKEQIGINHTQENIDHGHESVGQGDGEQRDGKWRKAEDSLRGKARANGRRDKKA